MWLFFSLCAKLLGLEIDSELSFTYHVEKLCKKLSRLDWIGVLNEKIRSCLPTKQRLLYYNTMIRSVLHYVSSIWTSFDKENLSRVFKLQKRTARVISDANDQASSVKLFNSLQWLPFTCSSVIITWSVCYRACAKVLRFTITNKHGRSTETNVMSSTAFCGRILSALRKKDGESGAKTQKCLIEI